MEEIVVESDLQVRMQQDNSINPSVIHTIHMEDLKHESYTWGQANDAHDDVIKWKHFPRYWPFVRGIHRSTVNSPHKGQWRGALMFSLIGAWINDWVNNREAGDMRRNRAHYDVIVMRNEWTLISLVNIYIFVNKILEYHHNNKHTLSICSVKYLNKFTAQWNKTIFTDLEKFMEWNPITLI